jgi:hypothetical protein
MTTEEAKQMLVLYRPNTADQEDPDFAEALRLCEEDAALRHWFEEHCSVYQSIRQKLKHVAVPEGLAEQIIAERKVSRPGFWDVPAVKTVIAGIAAVAAICLLILQWLPARENTGFSGFRDRMLSTALRNYAMDLSTQNMTDVRAYLQQHGAISDFEVPSALNNAELVGCVATTWQGKPVSMICFRSHHPLNPQKTSDLWLFVTDKSSVRSIPITSKPVLEQLQSWNVTTASWIENGKAYLLAIEGEEELLKQYL